MLRWLEAGMLKERGGCAGVMGRFESFVSWLPKTASRFVSATGVSGTGAVPGVEALPALSGRIEPALPLVESALHGSFVFLDIFDTAHSLILRVDDLCSLCAGEDALSYDAELCKEIAES